MHANRRSVKPDFHLETMAIHLAGVGMDHHLSCSERHGLYSEGKKELPVTPGYIVDHSGVAIFLLRAQLRFLLGKLRHERTGVQLQENAWYMRLFGLCRVQATKTTGF